jgi:hypothetical protein
MPPRGPVKCWLVVISDDAGWIIGRVAKRLVDRKILAASIINWFILGRGTVGERYFSLSI